MCSPFHDEKFAFFDFGVRGTPKILKIFLGVPPKILKKVGVLPASAKGFWLRPESAPAIRRRGESIGIVTYAPEFELRMEFLILI